MKSYTDISQSKKLAEIIPLESADMEYLAIKENGALVGTVPFVKDDSEVEDSAYNHTYDRIACWSLAALLKMMPKQFGRYTKSLYWFDNAWHCDYIDEDSEAMNNGTSADNPVDACVAMIEKLNELNLL